ncbi:MAG: MBL fold metallo-hydrolase [Candidatus Hodarchaeales archaeon]|jgi:glyoxylase-like metal-dependent hydrolase (beta-lactamase superfamily II)
MKKNSDLEISPERFHKQIQSGDVPLIVDVRNSKAFSDWNIFNSVNFPIMQLTSTKDFPEEFKDREIVLICGKGKDSYVGAERLSSYGFNVKSLIGGMTAWNHVFDTTEVTSDTDLKLIQLRRVAKGCLSYFLYSNGEAIVIDPAHNTSPYLKMAEEKDITITRIIDTHLHADHISGARDLAQKTGAEYFVSPNDPYNFEFNHIMEDDTFSIGNKILLRAMSTPGHTPGSTSLRMKDLGILTGDILFLDGIGRPDLANKSAEFAKDLYASLNSRLATLPENMFYAPAHHGKFSIDHFNSPLISTIQTFKENSLLQKDEKAFIEYAVQASQQTKQPSSHQTIRQVNSGKLILSPIQVGELEIGPNRCAIG